MLHTWSFVNHSLSIYVTRKFPFNFKKHYFLFFYHHAFHCYLIFITWLYLLFSSSSTLLYIKNSQINLLSWHLTAFINLFFPYICVTNFTSFIIPQPNSLTCSKNQRTEGRGRRRWFGMSCVALRPCSRGRCWCVPGRLALSRRLTGWCSPAGWWRRRETLPGWCLASSQWGSEWTRWGEEYGQISKQEIGTEWCKDVYITKFVHLASSQYGSVER